MVRGLLLYSEIPFEMLAASLASNDMPQTPPFICSNRKSKPKKPADGRLHSFG